MECRGKPIELECWPVEKIVSGRVVHPAWVYENFDNGSLFITVEPGHPRVLNVRTREGWLVAHQDGYLLQGMGKQIWPVALQDFQARYDLIE